MNCVMNYVLLISCKIQAFQCTKIKNFCNYLALHDSIALHETKNVKINFLIVKYIYIYILYLHDESDGQGDIWVVHWCRHYNVW